MLLFRLFILINKGHAQGMYQKLGSDHVMHNWKNRKKGKSGDPVH